MVDRSCKFVQWVCLQKCGKRLFNWVEISPVHTALP